MHTALHINHRFPSFGFLLLLLFAGCARKEFYAETPVTDTAVHQKLKEAPEAVDSVMVQAGSHYRRGPLYRLLLGTRHRLAWTAPVTVPVLNLDTAKGGLAVEKIGGGMQTISATMLAGNGKVYSLRTVDKRPSVELPPVIRHTFAADLVRDQTSALNPYAALVVAPLAKAAGIHTPTPLLVYVKPGEDRLGEHAELLSDRLYMLEERYGDKRSVSGSLVGAYDIISTKKMLANRYNHDNHSIDQLAYARARLFDLLIGDRDRHEGQWNWAAYKIPGGHLYRPIPKDRDNAFFKFDDGLFSWLLSRRWANRKFKTFDRNFSDIKALMIKSEYLDARAMPEVTAQQLDSIARVMQSELTDEVISQAVRKLPAAVYTLQGATLEQDLKSRRDVLDKAARKFYEILAEKALIIGTEQKDHFEVARLNDEQTEVKAKRASDGKVTFRRVFNRNETDEILLQGLSGDDTFKISGDVKKGIKLIIETGPGQDEILDESLVQGSRKKTIIVKPDRDKAAEKIKKEKPAAGKST